MKGWKGAAATAALVAGLVAAPPAHAGYLEDAGWGSLTVLANVFYMPAKLMRVTLGGLTGGMALALTGGDMATAETIWVTSMGGTYVLTPGMLQGRGSIEVTGRPSAPPTTAHTRPDEGPPPGGTRMPCAPPRGCEIVTSL